MTFLFKFMSTAALSFEKAFACDDRGNALGLDGNLLLAQEGKGFRAVVRLRDQEPHVVFDQVEKKGDGGSTRNVNREALPPVVLTYFRTALEAVGVTL